MKKKDFNKFIKMRGILFLLCLATILIGYEIYENYKDFDKRATTMRKNYIAQQKHIVKQEVIQAVDLIKYKIEQANKIEKDIEKILLETLSRIRFGKEGYVFVNKLNGDALISNGKVLSGSKKLWEVFGRDQEKMKELYQMEYDAAIKPNGDFIYYSFIKLTDSQVESPKVSFIHGIPKLQWLVGAGVYLDDVEKDILLLKNELGSNLKSKLIYSIVIVVVVIMFFLFLLNIFLNKLKDDLDQFELFFKRAARENEPINLANIKFAQLEEMAQNANNMLEEKIKAQLDLIDEREQLFVTIRSVGDALITTDAIGKIDLMNMVAEKLTGWKNEDAKGKELTEVFSIVNEKSREVVKNPVSTVLAKGEIVGLANHTILISKDGTEYNISDSAAPIKDANKNVRGVVLVFRDITEEYKIQEESRRSEERYKITTDATGEVYYRLNFSNMSYEYIHPNVEKLTGYKANEFDLKRIIMDIEKRGNSLQLNQLEEKRIEAIIEFYNADYLIKTKSGEEKWIADVSFPIFDEDGKQCGSYGVLSDISNRKEMEKKLVKAKENAEKADRLKSTFLAQMSHEIRTPINALVSMSSLLRYDFEESADEDQLLSFDIIDRAGGRIIRTVDLLLNLSEIQAGTYETNFTQFDIVSDIFTMVIAEHKKLAAKKNIKFSLNVVAEDTELITDLYTVNQIFTQLVDNAIKYTDEGEVNIKIFRNDFEQLIVEVSDTGIGVEDEYLPQLFEPFTQEEMGYTRKFEGNGIGLALVKKYCELNNAKIEVESEKNKGSIFRIIFQ